MKTEIHSCPLLSLSIMSKHKIQRRAKAHKYAGTTGHRLHAINMKNPNSQNFQLKAWIIRKFEYKWLAV